MKDLSHVVVIVPAFNEQEALPGVIDDLRREAPGASVVVVDDGSRDRTAEVAVTAGSELIQLPFNVGVGGALRAGLLRAQRDGARAAVQCDADGQHPAASIADLVAGLAEADIVIGARFAGEGDYHVRGPRGWAMSFLAKVMSRLHRTRLTDVTSGFRAFGPRAIAVLAKELPPDYLGDTVEALVIAKQYGLVVRQIPVSMRERQGGVASHPPFKAMLFLFRVMLILGLALVRLIGGRARQK